MRLEITRRAELAVRALSVLKGAGSSPLKAPALARALGTTPGFVTQIVQPLIKEGWVRSEPGPTGGYSLLVDLGTVTVLDVIEAVDGPTATGRCVVEDRPCGDQRCILHDAWTEARRVLLDALDAVVLTEVTATGG